MHVRNERYVDQSKVCVTDAELKLAHCFDERGRFNITHGASKLIQYQLGVGNTESGNLPRQCIRRVLLLYHQPVFWRRVLSNLGLRSLSEVRSTGAMGGGVNKMDSVFVVYLHGLSQIFSLALDWT